MYMAFRKRSLDLPLPPDESQSTAKHARSAALPSIHSLAEIAGHGSADRMLPAMAAPMLLGGKGGRSPEHSTGRPGELSLAAIRVSSPRNMDSPPQLPPQPQQPHQQLRVTAVGVVPGDGIKVARNWSRDETLSLVRAIGRHYESLKRCKTNQERSNIWHRIHKEHSSQFPGRSKKASQDRWGKVLSDYKDVMVHNKEKGAARWTFDFFKEVAAIVEGDAQFMEMALSCGASRSPGHSPPPLLQSTGQPGTDDLSSYSFGGASRPPHHTAGAGPPPPPPLGHHRMSEPNLAPHLYSGGYNASHGLRAQPSFRAAQQQQQQHPHHHPQQSHHHHHHYRHFPHGQKMSPIELCSAATAAPGPLSAFEGRQNGRYSPSRRTSYPQMQAHMIGSAALGQPLPPPPQQQQQMLAATPVPASAGAVDGKFPSHQRHSIQVLSPPFHQGRGSVVSLPAHPGSGGRDTPVGRLSPGDNLAEPERACRYVLDMLETQVRRIDAQHDALGQLRASTQDAIARVEQVLQRYTHPQS